MPTPGLSLFHRFSAEDRQRAVAALERVGIAEKADNRADQLSGGQQQRVGIARALMQEPRLMLADEPVASLDPVLAHSILQYLELLNQQDGITVLCSLHFLDLVHRYATRVIGLKDGELVFDGLPSELTPRAIQRGVRRRGRDGHRRRHGRDAGIGGVASMSQLAATTATIRNDNDARPRPGHAGAAASPHYRWSCPAAGSSSWASAGGASAFLPPSSSWAALIAWQGTLALLVPLVFIWLWGAWDAYRLATGSRGPPGRAHPAGRADRLWPGPSSPPRSVPHA